MKELIELLNERIKEGWKPYGDDYSITKIDEIWKSDGLYFVSFVGEDYPGPVNLEHLLTKQAGLIKRLVENGKIDIFKSGIDELPRTFGYDYESVECKSDRLVMMLSIQNNPIEFLVSII